MTLPARQPHRLSQCARILAVLEDGRPHTVAEIHERAGYSRLNSRIAELRKRGHVITCTHISGETGTHSYVYELSTDEPSGGTSPRLDNGAPLPTVAVAGTDGFGSAASSVETAGEPRPLDSPAQLSLEAA